MNPKGNPQEASNSGKMRAFFKANPDAQITPHELAKMLGGLTKVQTYNVMRNLKAQGICESVRIVRAKK